VRNTEYHLATAKDFCYAFHGPALPLMLLLLITLQRIVRSISIYFARLGHVSDSSVHPRALPSAWDRRNYQAFAILQEPQVRGIVITEE
ncbi:MAG: hypothetical protein JXK93_05965, partial [Sphaerochaetaceae bacterium]|nr:hypothetical protein [Sphaerochaetaceae bacterium]